MYESLGTKFWETPRSIFAWKFNGSDLSIQKWMLSESGFFFPIRSFSNGLWTYYWLHLTKSSRKTEEDLENLIRWFIKSRNRCHWSNPVFSRWETSGISNRIPDWNRETSVSSRHSVSYKPRQPTVFVIARKKIPIIWSKSRSSTDPVSFDTQRLHSASTQTSTWNYTIY